MAADDGVAEGVGDGDPAGLDDAPGDADLPDGTAADGLAEAEPDGLGAGEGEALADGEGVTGGGVDGAGVGSSAFAYAGNMTSSARPSTAPSRNVRNIHR